MEIGTRTIIRNIPKERLILDKISPKKFWFIFFPVALPCCLYYMYLLASLQINTFTIITVFVTVAILNIIFLGVCNIKFTETGFDILNDYIINSKTIYIEKGEVINAKKIIRNKKSKKRIK